MCYSSSIKVGDAEFLVSECGGGVSLTKDGETVAGSWDRDTQQVDLPVADEVKTALVKNLVGAGR